MNLIPHIRLFPLLLTSVAGCCATAVAASQFADASADRGALPAVPPEFEVGFFAREPMVRNPCSIAFDERGRMFVSHGPQYRSPKPDTPPDSVVILDDTNGDAVADAVRTFATGFNCIQGLAWHGKDLWVANAPDLTVVRDTDGDDVADEYIRVFTDLGNIEHALHGLNWAPDGRLYMSKGNSKGLVVRDWKKDEPDRIAPKPFRDLWGVPGPKDAPDFPAPKTFTRQTYQSTYHDPEDDWGRSGGILRCEDMGRNLEVVSRGLRNPYGIGFDAGFDWLGVDQDQGEGDRFFMPFYSSEFGWSHAWSPHWTGENHLPTVPISGPVFLGSGTGVLFADAPNWPEKFRGVWLINDWLFKKTQVYRPSWQGALMLPQGGQWEDFIVGEKSLFRPVDMAFGPEGALYIIGWSSGYGVERDKDGNMTNEGRVFRVMPKGAAKLPAVPVKKLPDMTVAELIAEFSSVLPVRRINAQDELVRRGAGAVGGIVAALKAPGLPTAGETWAVWTLARIGGNDRFLQSSATNTAASFNRRIQAIRALGFVKASALPELLPALLASPEPRLRLAAIQAAHQAGAKDSLSTLTNHAATESERICYYATWRALRDLGGEVALRPLLADKRGPVRAAALLGLLDLGAMKPAALTPLANDADKTVAAVARLGLGRGVMKQRGEVFKGGTADLANAPENATPVSPLASNIAAESKRRYASGTLRKNQPSYTDRPYAFTRVPESLDGAEIIRTSNEDEASRGNSFLTFDLALASTVLVAHDVRIKQRPEWMQGFADSDLTVATNDTQFRLWSKDFPAGKVALGGNIPATSEGPKANYLVVIQPKPLNPQATPTGAEPSLAALAKADARRGEALFFHSAACATCHRVGNRGINFGPDLTNLGARMEAKYIVQSILEPNAVITEGFSARVIEAGGKSHFGVLLSTGRTVRLGVVAGGQIVEIPEDKITKHETLPVSPMPPMGSLLSPQDVADITKWLMTAEQKAAAASPTRLKPANTSPLSVIEKPDRLIIRQGGAVIGEFVFADAKIRRPFFANLRAPGGIPVTRAWPPVEGVDATDHADMHPGVWLGFGDISGQDFWRNKATMKHEAFAVPPAWKENRLEFATRSSLLAADGTKMATMRCEFTLAPKGRELHLSWAAAITPGIDGFYFGDQEEMGFGVRMATPLIEKNGGLITSSTGKTTAKATWGQPAEWCDYSGTLNGKRAGARIIPDPANIRPSWWHVRDYGVFVANPFGRKAMEQGEESRIDVKKGETHPMKFNVVFHTGER
jgi:putative membrane-bound dehydrogenase-like protein